MSKLEKRKCEGCGKVYHEFVNIKNELCSPCQSNNGNNKNRKGFRSQN